MTAEELVYDILEIKKAVEDDRDIDEFWLLNKINMYRSVIIAQDYALNNELRSEWMQRLRKQKCIRVTAADDPAITNSSVVLGKVTLPKVVSLPENVGLVRVSGSSGITSFDEIDFDTLMLKIAFNEERMGEFGYMARIGDDAYFYPLTREIQAVLIAADPFSIQVIDPVTKSLRDMTITDEYPMDLATAQQVAIEILTKDLQISMQSIADITNDSQNQLKILQSENSKRQASN